ncbi:hypothetical protein N9I05_01475 [Pseudomonadales bacterium]|nr:hypothetical protein [Pseudomonadales bacterium]
MIASDIIAFALDMMLQEDLFKSTDNNDEPTDEEIEWANQIILNRIENSNFEATESELYDLMQIKLKV